MEAVEQIAFQLSTFGAAGPPITLPTGGSLGVDGAECVLCRRRPPRVGELFTTLAFGPYFGAPVGGEFVIGSIGSVYVAFERAADASRRIPPKKPHKHLN